MEQTPVDDCGASTLAPVSEHTSRGRSCVDQSFSSREGVDTTKIELASKILDCDGEFRAQPVVLMI